MPNANLSSARRGLFGTAEAVFLVLLVATLGQMAWYYPRLPDRMASHFNFAGQPNAFMSKPEFMTVNLVVVGLLTLTFLLVPMLVVRLPASMINLPNKAYWLAPERRASTARTLQGFLVGYGNVLLLFLLVVFREAMRASLLSAPHLSHSLWLALALLGGSVIYWTVRFTRAFRLPR